MAAQNSADFPFSRGHAAEHGRTFGALVQTLGRTAIFFIKKILSPSCKKNWSRFVPNRCSRDWGSCLWTQKNSKQLQNLPAKKQFENNWEVEKRKPNGELVEPDPFLEKVSQKTLALAKTFLKKNEDKSK